MFRKFLTAFWAVLVAASLLFGGCGGGGTGDPIDPPPPVEKEEREVFFHFADSKGPVGNLPYSWTAITRTRIEEKRSDANGDGSVKILRTPGTGSSITVTSVGGYFATTVIDVPANIDTIWDSGVTIRVTDNPVQTRQFDPIEISIDNQTLNPFTLQIIGEKGEILSPKLNDPNYELAIEKLVECADLIFVGADQSGYTFRFTDIGQYKITGWSDELPRPVRAEGTVVIYDRQPPVLRWPDGTPQNGAEVKDQITLTASVRDNHRLKRAVMKLDETEVASITRSDQSPLTFVWDTTKSVNGSHTITVEAEDETGNTATPLVLNLTVENSTVTPIGTTDTTKILDYSGREWTCDWGPNGEFGPSPQFGATIARTSQGDLYVGDTSFDADGKDYQIGAWKRGQVGIFSYFAPYPTYGNQFMKFASDSLGNVFAHDFSRGVLQKFDPETGRELASLRLEDLSTYSSLIVDDHVDEEGNPDNEVWVHNYFEGDGISLVVQHFSSGLEPQESVSLIAEGVVRRLFVSQDHGFLLYAADESLNSNNSTVIRWHDLETHQTTDVLTIDHSINGLFFIEGSDDKPLNQFIIFYSDYLSGETNPHRRGVLQYDRDWKQFHETTISMELGFQDVLQGADRKSFWLLEGGYYLQAGSDPPARELVFR